MNKLLPSINGLRAISILLVIISHVAVYYQADWFIGQFGVNVFFILSGYLITRLLLVEEESKGTINLKKFYVRRTLRIFPAYYFMLLVYFILQVAGIIYLNSFAWLTALTYTKYF
ncbi:MAG TPA: acyltransferase, partial [Chitinophagaceae bacterium]|nr:acyltransferase [Chitinophagaceae bacterium]